VTALLLGLLVLQTAHYYPQLPERMVSQWSTGGEPNSYTGKNELMGVFGGTSILIVLSMHVLGLRMRRLPEEKINIPHRQHWLSAERREDTFHRLETYMLWCGNMTLLFILGLFHGVLIANLPGRDGRLSDSGWFWGLGYLAYLTIHTIRFTRFFRNTDR